jgi:glycosyltransferase involved in cell wall biosynthesis
VIVPLVSIVIPAYNASRFIEATLETVAAQTWRDFEVIVVDDGSKDDTQAVAARFLERRSLAGQAFRQENKKIAGARNAGVERARGALVSFLDHDDLWLPRKLEVVVAAFAANPQADVVCHDEEIVQDGRVLRRTRRGPWTPDIYERLLFGGNDLSPSAVTVRRPRLLEAGGFREGDAYNTVEDYDLWMRLAKSCRFHYVSEVLGQYQLVAGAASARVVYHHSNLEGMLRDHFAAYPRRDARTRLAMRRRLADVYRSAARALKSQGAGGAVSYAWRAVRTFPADPKNAAALALSLLP